MWLPCRLEHRWAHPSVGGLKVGIMGWLLLEMTPWRVECPSLWVQHALKGLGSGIANPHVFFHKVWFFYNILCSSSSCHFRSLWWRCRTFGQDHRKVLKFGWEIGRIKAGEGGEQNILYHQVVRRVEWIGFAQKSPSSWLSKGRLTVTM